MWPDRGKTPWIQPRIPHAVPCLSHAYASECWKEEAEAEAEGDNSRMKGAMRRLLCTRARSQSHWHIHDGPISHGRAVWTGHGALLCFPPLQQGLVAGGLMGSSRTCGVCSISLLRILALSLPLHLIADPIAARRHRQVCALAPTVTSSKPARFQQSGQSTDVLSLDELVHQFLPPKRRWAWSSN